MNKYDYMLTGLLLIVCLFSIFIFRFNSTQGDYVLIKYDGSEYTRLPLDRNCSLRVPESGPDYNTIIIEDSCAYISDADCPDRICVSHGKIHLNGESVICLPHRLSVTIVSYKDLSNKNGNWNTESDSKNIPDNIDAISE